MDGNSPEVFAQGLVLRAAPPTWVLTLVIVPAIIAFAVLAYRMGGRGVPTPVKFGLGTLRVLVLLLITFLLMDPAFESIVVERRPTLTVGLVDASASMSTQDSYEAEPALAGQVRSALDLDPNASLEAYSRLSLVQQLLGPGSSLDIPKLIEERKLDFFSFGDRLQPLSDLQDLQAIEPVTMLGRALERIVDEPDLKGRGSAAVVLFSDGKNTAGPAPVEILDQLASKRIPVHVVAVGDPSALRDVEIRNVLYSTVVLSGDVATFEVEVGHRGFPGESIEVRLVDDGRVLTSERARLGTGEDATKVELQFRADREGSFTWTLEVVPLPGEHQEENNRREIKLEVKDRVVDVLYVETRPRWEYRALKNFLIRSPDAFRTQCFLLEADPDFAQESSPGVPPLRSFPETEEALQQYDVILFGDVDPLHRDFSGGDAELAERIFQAIATFVEKGGGFGLIAGQDFAPREYGGTALEEVLPVLLDPADTSSGNPSVEFRPRLTAQGRDHPIIRIAEMAGDAERNTRLWEDRSEFEGPQDSYWFAPVKRAKPTAIALAVHPNATNGRGEAYPIMVAGTYGEGPVYFTSIDDTWSWFKWQGPKWHHQYWGNVVRFLARASLLKGDRRFQLISDRSEYQVGQTVTLTAYVLDRTYRPAEFDVQELNLLAPTEGAEPERIRMPKVAPGEYRYSFAVERPGTWKAWLPPEDRLSEEEPTPVSFRVEITDLENREPVLDMIALREIADRTGGSLVMLDEAPELLESLTQRTEEVPRQRRFLPLRAPEAGYLLWLMLSFLGLLALEWIVRKRFRYP